MTFRAVIIGLVAAVLMVAGGQFCDKHVPVPSLVRGHLPISVFGLLIVYVALINPLLGCIWGRMRLKASEIALVFAMFLIGSSITDAGLMRFVPSSWIWPIEQNRLQPSWRQTGLLAMTPPELLANNGRYSREVVANYVQAMGDEGRPIGIDDVPWQAWQSPIMIWGAVILGTFGGIIALSVLVHSQWARREKIQYPLAEVATSLLAEPGSNRPNLLRSHLFWAGLSVPLVIQVVNGLYVWFPESIQIPLTLDFSAFKNQFPDLLSTPGAGYFASPRIFPACVGLTFLLATDIGFSLGITNVLSVFALYLMITLGADVSLSYSMGGWIPWQNFGSFAAMAAILFYIGRRHYWRTFRAGVLFVPTPDADTAGVWAWRVLLICSASVCAILIAVGLDWPLAVLSVVLALMMFLVLGRMNAECGTFFFKPSWLLPAAMVGLFGVSTLGPRMFIILGLLTYMWMGDPFESLMPFVLNGMKATTDTHLRPGRVGLVLAAGLGLAIVVAVPVSLWAEYNYVGHVTGGQYMVSTTYAPAPGIVKSLDSVGALAEVEGWTPWQRVCRMQPDRRFWPAVAVGFALVIALSMMRLRYSWWPLHPVILLGFGSWTMGKYGASFFLGWMIKAAVMRFGGGRGFASVRQLMIGVIVGDLSGAFVMTVVAWLYYAITGTDPPGYGFW